MKKHFVLASFVMAAALYSCSDNNTHGSETTNSTEVTTTTDSTHASGLDQNQGAANSVNTTPLNREDSLFVMEAAAGGMMEVEAGNLAQQNASSQRVKDFGAMMVRDHSNANNELKSFASSHNIMLPDSLPKKMRDHLMSMQKMKGKAFDRHYMGMMVTDHKEDVSKFEKTANSGGNPDLKNWAAKTLPVLKMHSDSARAVNKGL